MEPNSRKNDDCYFYYYSTCLKGENCLFRHEENALGCEVVCQYWKEGKCLNERCNFRHMELKKNRKVIPCYWETQPSGCRKPHCPFRHMNQKDKPPDKSKDGNVSNTSMVMSGGVLNVPGSTAGRNPSTDGSVPGPTVVRGDINYSANPVDPIVVKFEEESDNESVQSSSPIKSTLPLSSSRRNPSSPSRVKTLEEIRLERIQQQSAAFYDFGDMECDVDEPDYEFPGNFNLSRRVSVLPKVNLFENERKERCYSDFKVLTLDEIRKNRQKRLSSCLKGNNSDGECDVTSHDVNSDDGDRKRCRYNKIQSSVLPDSTSEAGSNCNDKIYIPSKINSYDAFSYKDDYENASALKDSDNRAVFTKTTDNSRVSIVNPDTDVKNEYCNNDETEPHYKQKPIKLRRFIKRSIDDEDNTNDNNVKRKLKRIKLNLNNKDAVCSSSIAEINSKECNFMDQDIIKSNENSFTDTESRLTVSHCAGNQITDVSHEEINLKSIKVNKNKDVCFNSVINFDKKNNTGRKENSKASVYRTDDNTELWLTSSPIRDDEAEDDATLNILKDIDDLLND